MRINIARNTRIPIHLTINLIWILVAAGMVFGDESTNNVVINRYGFSISKFDGLMVRDCVHILNEYTHFRINGEMPSRFTPPSRPTKNPKLEFEGLAGCGGFDNIAYFSESLPKNHTIDLNLLGPETPFETVTAVLEQDPEYSVTRRGDYGGRVAWKKLPTSSVYALNQSIPQFSLEEGDLLDAFILLNHFVPSLEMFHPFHLSGTNGLHMAEAQRQQCGGKKMSVKLENPTIRDVLNEVAASQSNMYWIAEYGTNGVLISFYSDEEHAGRHIIEHHDPAIQERIR